MKKNSIFKNSGVSRLEKALFQYEYKKLPLSEKGHIGKNLLAALGVHDKYIVPAAERNSSFLFKQALKLKNAVAMLPGSTLSTSAVFMLTTPSRSEPDNPHKSHACVIVYNKNIITVQDSMLTQDQTKKDKTIKEFIAALIQHKDIPHGVTVHYENNIQQYKGEQDCTVWTYINGMHLLNNKALIVREGEMDSSWINNHKEVIKELVSSKIKFNDLAKIKANFLKIRRLINDDEKYNIIIQKIEDRICSELKDSKGLKIHKIFVSLDVTPMCEQLKSVKDISKLKLGNAELLGIDYLKEYVRENLISKITDESVKSRVEILLDEKLNALIKSPRAPKHNNLLKNCPEKFIEEINKASEDEIENLVSSLFKKDTFVKASTPSPGV